ncbi:hypothetical protein CEXT_654761 [Caerostris extrusa]|uniref:Uncharacterized protein n=1 Tax=Caerostris extrusa TaxID=172846 RepID=A0AAV4V9R9_CAEEX|nr:hypothetical protein CEXT_654761 [Caerostris extrusa]
MVKEPINPGDFWRVNNWRCYSALFIREKLDETIPDNEETEDCEEIPLSLAFTGKPIRMGALFLCRVDSGCFLIRRSFITRVWRHWQE